MGDVVPYIKNHGNKTREEILFERYSRELAQKAAEKARMAQAGQPAETPAPDQD